MDCNQYHCGSVVKSVDVSLFLQPAWTDWSLFSGKSVLDCKCSPKIIISSKIMSTCVSDNFLEGIRVSLSLLLSPTLQFAILLVVLLSLSKPFSVLIAVLSHLLTSLGQDVLTDVSLFLFREGGKN